MMTQQLGFSILTAPLAAIDRRTLSQAWYSALHVATKPLHASNETVMAMNSPVCRSATLKTPVKHVADRGGGARVIPRKQVGTARILGAEQERRAPRSPLARKIERCFLDPARHTERASFTLEGSKARVHVALATTTNGVRLVAVCPPSVRERVMRALDEARYALAARGIALCVDFEGDLL